MKTPKLVQGRIDTTAYGFIQKAEAGDYDEALECSVINRVSEWKWDSPALLNAVEDVVRKISEQTGEVSYAYVGYLLNIINNKVKEKGEK